MSSNDTQIVDVKRRKILTGATGVVGAVGVTFLAVPFLSSWQPSERAKAAGAPVDVSIGALQAGQMLTVAWRGKPIYVVHRTEKMIKNLSLVIELSDPTSEDSIQPKYCQNEMRSIKPEYLVLIGVCTHLGCAPTYTPKVGAASGVNDTWPGGFFCPCHGSKFDLSGRVFKDVPAPTNLVVPPYHYLTETKLRIGVSPKGVKV